MSSLDEEQFVYVIPKPAVVPPGDISQAEWDELLAAYQDLLDQFAVFALDDLSDVETSGAVDGQTLVYDSSLTPPWQPGGVSGSVAYIKSGATLILENADRLNFDTGLDVEVDGSIPTQANVFVAFAGTGSANTVARSDHTHNSEVRDILTGAATGVLSSGTRTLSSATLNTLLNGVTYDVTATAYVRCRNNINNGNANLILRIGSDAFYPARTRTIGTVGGVPVDQIISFHGGFVGAGVGLALQWQIQFSSGDPVDVRDWELIYSFRPRR
jgi:hypothetical protein